MYKLIEKNLAASWANYLSSGNKTTKSDHDILILAVLTLVEKLEGLWNYKVISDGVHKHKYNECLHILTKSLHFHGIETLDVRYVTPLEMVQGFNKSNQHLGYLPLAIVSALISVKKYLTLSKSYPKLPHVGILCKEFMEEHLSSWESVKMIWIIACEENISFDGSPESWTVFCIESTGVLIKRDLLKLLSSTTGLTGVPFRGDTPPYQFFQSIYLGKVLQMSVNNTTLCWPMLEGNMNVIRLWFWLKVRYVLICTYRVEET